MPVLGFLELNLGVIAACLPTFIALSRSKLIKACRHRIAVQAKSIRLDLGSSKVCAKHRPAKEIDVENDVETNEERPGRIKSYQSILYPQDADKFESTVYSEPVDKTEQQRSWIMR